MQNLEVGKFVDFETLYGDNEFIVVEGQEFLPDYRPGDLIGGPRTLGGNIDNLIGLSECIVETKAGDRLIRYVHRGSRPGRFTLRSSRPATPDITDVQISWAIPIRIILRR